MVCGKWNVGTRERDFLSLYTPFSQWGYFFTKNAFFCACCGHCGHENAFFLFGYI